MNFDNVKVFFDDFVKKYVPYRDKRLYTAIIDFITDRFLEELYTEVPNQFIKLFEDNVLDVSVYNQLLQSIGVPEDLIQNLTNDQKLIFLQSLSDFQRYKGTVKFFRNVANTFSDNFDIYELYVDYKISSEEDDDGIGVDGTPPPEYDNLVYDSFNNVVMTTDQTFEQIEVWSEGVGEAIYTSGDELIIANGALISEDFGEEVIVDMTPPDHVGQNLYPDTEYPEPSDNWVLKPKLVYNGSGADPRNTILYYEDIYNQIPSLLMSTTQLEKLRQNGGAVFPFKTNLILLDYNVNTNISLMNNLMLAAVLRAYRNERITLYFSETTFDFTLGEIFYIWHYIITKNYGVIWKGRSALISIIRLSHELLSNGPGVNWNTLEYFHSLMDQVNNLSNTSDIIDFFNTYIMPYDVNYSSIDLTVGDMEDEILGMNRAFYDYFIDRIDTPGSSEEMNNILTDIYNSLSIFHRSNNISDPYFNQYFTSFLQSLPYIVINPENFVSYTVLYNLKPFHSEFVTQHNDTLVSDDIFNIATPYDGEYTINIT